MRFFLLEVACVLGKTGNACEERSAGGIPATMQRVPHDRARESTVSRAASPTRVAGPAARPRPSPPGRPRVAGPATGRRGGQPGPGSAPRHRARRRGPRGGPARSSSREAVERRARASATTPLPGRRPRSGRPGTALRARSSGIGRWRPRPRAAGLDWLQDEFALLVADNEGMVGSRSPRPEQVQAALHTLGQATEA